MIEAHRARLLRVHAHRLRREDLEDCYGQAALELIARARQGAPYVSVPHITRVLEQRFISRIHDRRRALEGRSAAAAAFEHALASDLFGGAEEQIVDRHADLHRQVEMRMELQRIARLLHRLTPDQREVMASQIYQQVDCAEFCARRGWTPEKYRKVAQRARCRLRELVESHE